MPFLRPRSRYWSDLTSEEFSRLDRDRLIAVLPVGATEQHGPHLPMSTDTATIDGMVRATLPHLPDDLPVLFLPTVAYGKSNEHSRYPGTLTVSASTLIAHVERHRRLRGRGPACASWCSTTAMAARCRSWTSSRATCASRTT